MRQRRTTTWRWRVVWDAGFIGLSVPNRVLPFLLALLSEPDVVRKVLLHLGLPADLPPTAPARNPALFDDDFQTGTPARSPP